MKRAIYDQDFNSFYITDDGLSFYRVNLGERQHSICEFAAKYPGLHSYNPKERERIIKLVEYGLIKHYPESCQFEFNSRTAN